MNRLISILITLFVLFLVYIWINSVQFKKEDNNKSFASAEVVSSTSAVDEDELKLSNYDKQKKDAHDNVASNAQTNDAKDLVKVGEVDAPPPATNKDSESNGSENKDSSSKGTTTKPSEKRTAEKKAIQPTVTTQKTVKTKVNDPARLHMVIAGNFVERANAESRVKELERQGYKNIEIVNFDLSQYYTVCAGRYNDIMEARRISKKLRDFENIPAYVRVGKS